MLKRYTAQSLKFHIQADLVVSWPRFMYIMNTDTKQTLLI